MHPRTSDYFSTARPFSFNSTLLTFWRISIFTSFSSKIYITNFKLSGLKAAAVNVLGTRDRIMKKLITKPTVEFNPAFSYVIIHFSMRFSLI